jgi:uncharacterized protein (DUF58 family)
VGSAAPGNVLRKTAAALFAGLPLPERKAWIRFLAAMVGLAAAFAAALFSTVTREAGDLWGTAILASLALLLAAFVGVITVPYLARQVVGHRARQALDYEFTREGAAYLVLTVLIGVAALNTGNNLLFIVVSVMLAAVLVSGVVSASVLRGLELDVALPDHVFARTRGTAKLMLTNPRRLAASYSVSVVVPKAKQRRRLVAERTRFRFPLKRPWIALPDIKLRLSRPPETMPPIFDGAVYFPYLPARSSASAEVELQFPRRGRYTQQSFGLATRFPFSFLIKTREMPLERELIVYPAVNASDEMLETLPMITGEFESFVRGRGYDLYRIREHQPGDSVRHVDWKATAKTDGLKVREFTREDERKLRIVFDNPVPGYIRSDRYENAVETAASLAWHFADGQTELSFAAPGFQGDDIYEFLRYLALVAPEDEPSLLDTLDISDDYNLIVTARPPGSIPTALWNCSYFIFVGPHRRGSGAEGGKDTRRER